MTIAAVLTAAGAGVRLGKNQPKALVHVAGRPLVAWALDNVCDVADVVVVTAPAGHEDAFAEVVGGLAHARTTEVLVVTGGETRQRSVYAGIHALDSRSAHPEVVLVHDAARAFQPVVTMRLALAAVDAGADGAVPVLPLVDTLVAVPDADGVMGAGVDRDSFRAVQTPQVFRWNVLRDSHLQAQHKGQEATDDASLAREAGFTVMATEGHPHGMKITTAADLALATHIAETS